MGQTLEIIVEGYHLETDLLMRGRHQGQCPDIDGMVIINDGRNIHSFSERYKVEITQAAGYNLVGKVL